jgi:hypothetical protein
MKKIISSLSILLLIISLYSGCREKENTEITEQIKIGLRKDSKEFMETLKAVLVKEMQTNGIVSAVSVCADTAQILTNDYGIKKGIFVKRVSFKNRNPNNYPDKFETSGLKYFEELKSQNKLDENSEYYQVIENDGIKIFRYLKPIVIQAPCLNCHGNVENINTEIKTILHNKYPEDKATGYKVDNLRGAVSIQKTL